MHAAHLHASPQGMRGVPCECLVLWAQRGTALAWAPQARQKRSPESADEALRPDALLSTAARLSAKATAAVESPCACNVAKSFESVVKTALSWASSMPPTATVAVAVAIAPCASRT
eukprot:5444249-Pleurochrysis_carterae.AAC.3